MAQVVTAAMAAPMMQQRAVMGRPPRSSQPGPRSLHSYRWRFRRDLTGAIVHDRYQNYDKFPGVLHQLCTAHLLRDLQDAGTAILGALTGNPWMPPVPQDA
jgi:Transposase IS66 family